MTDDTDRSQLPGRAVVVARRLVDRVRTLGEETDSIQSVNTLVVDCLVDRLVVDCLDLVGVDGVAVRLSDSDGAVTASSEELAQAMESVKRRGWEDWSDGLLLGQGFFVRYAFPLRHQQDGAGMLYLFLADRPPLTAADLDAAQALADAAAVTLVHQRRLFSAAALAEQLQIALNSRIAVERATGVLSEYGGIGMGASFDALRQYARSHRVKLTQVAQDVIERRLDLGQIVPRRRTREG